MIGDLAWQFQADLHKAAILLSTVPGGLEYELSSVSFRNCVHIGLMFLH